MRDRALLPAAGQFYKANLHCHTVLSDGRWTKEQVKAEYQKRGYSIVAFTDHRHYGWHPELMDDTFIPIAAYEADLNGPFPPSGSFQWVKTYHLNFYDTDPASRGGFTAVQPPQQYGDLEALNGFIARMNAGGFLCCYNHPYWSLQNYNDYAGLKGAFAMEIYNHGCELDGLYGYAPQAYDEMLRAGQKLFCVATDDNHDTYAPGDPRCDSFGGFTMFKLEKLTYASVIEALKKGDFYASTGPELQELSIRDGALCVRCSPVEKIYVVTSGRRCLMQLASPRADPDRGVLPPEWGTRATSGWTAGTARAGTPAPTPIGWTADRWPRVQFARLASAGQGRRLFLLSWVAYAAAYVGRYNYSAVMSAITAEGTLTLSAAGAVSTGYFVCYAAGQILCGILSQKCSPFGMIPLGLVLSAGCNFGMGRCPGGGHACAVGGQRPVSGHGLAAHRPPVCRVYAL